MAVLKLEYIQKFIFYWFDKNCKQFKDECFFLTEVLILKLEMYMIVIWDFLVIKLWYTSNIYESVI